VGGGKPENFRLNSLIYIQCRKRKKKNWEGAQQIKKKKNPEFCIFLIFREKMSKSST